MASPNHFMSMILTIEPAVEPVSVAELKAHLRITHSDDDEFLSKLIVAARRQIEARTSLRLLAQTWKVFLDRWPDDGVITIPIQPVISVSALKVYSADDVAAEIDPAHYYLDAASKPPRLALRAGRNAPQPGRGLNGIEVTLQAGFGATAASVPQELKQALLLIVGGWFANRGEESAGQISLVAQELIRSFRIMRLT